METKKPIKERAQDFYNALFDKELLELMDVAEGKKPSKKLEEQYDFDEDPAESAREIIEGHGYGISKETVYYVTLAGGGPAARLKVAVDENGEVEDASLQFCDWYQEWTDAPNQDYRLVERYARLFSYYE